VRQAGAERRDRRKMCGLRAVSLTIYSHLLYTMLMLRRRPVQAGMQEWKGRIAIRSFEDEEHSRADLSAPLPSLAPFLCYVCHTTFTSRGARAPPALYQDDPTLSHDLTPLPIWTAGSLPFHTHVSRSVGNNDPELGEEELHDIRKLQRSEMRDVVKEFLLDE
jgi:cytoplasmic tRNA 2-thiolation protein 2